MKDQQLKEVTNCCGSCQEPEGGHFWGSHPRLQTPPINLHPPDEQTSKVMHTASKTAERHHGFMCKLKVWPITRPIRSKQENKRGSWETVWSEIVFTLLYIKYRIEPPSTSQVCTVAAQEQDEFSVRQTNYLFRFYDLQVSIYKTTIM